MFYHATGDRKFFLYYTLNEAPGGRRKIIGVAVADSPLGPFADRGRDDVDDPSFGPSECTQRVDNTRGGRSETVAHCL